MSDGNLVKLAEFGSYIDAELVRMRLKDNGIEAVIFGGSLLMASPDVRMPMVELMVMDRDVEAAMVILQDEQYAAAGDADTDDDDETDNLSEGGDDFAADWEEAG